MPEPTAAATLGVEEEFQIVDPETRQLRSRAGRVLPLAQASLGDEVTNELYLSQIEVGTPVCRSLGEARAPQGGHRGGGARRRPDRLVGDSPVLALGRADLDSQASVS